MLLSTSLLTSVFPSAPFAAPIPLAKLAGNSRFVGYSSDDFVEPDQRVVWKAPELVGSRQCELVAY